MTCSYEEVTTGGYLPLWFNQPDGAMLFQFLKQPISYHQYTGRKRERIGVNDRMQWEDLGGGTVRRAASSLPWMDSWPSHDAVGGLWSFNEPVRTALTEMLRGGSGSHDDVPSRRWRPRGRIAGARRHRRDYTQITAEFEAIRTASSDRPASRPNALKIGRETSSGGDDARRRRSSSCARKTWTTSSTWKWPPNFLEV